MMFREGLDGDTGLLERATDRLRQPVGAWGIPVDADRIRCHRDALPGGVGEGMVPRQPDCSRHDLALI